MRKAIHRRHRVGSLLSFWLSLAVCLLSLTVIANEKSQCRYSLDLEAAKVHEHHTGRELLLTPDSMAVVTKLSPKQCQGTCYAERTLNVLQNLIEHHLDRRLSVNRVDFLARIFRWRIGYYLTGSEWRALSEKDKELRSDYVLWDLATYHERRQQLKARPEQLAAWEKYEEVYDILSGGTFYQGARPVRDPVESERSDKKLLGFAVELVPRKTPEDVELENQWAAEMISAFTKATHTHYKEALRDSLRELRRMKERLAVKKGFPASRLYSLVHQQQQEFYTPHSKFRFPLKRSSFLWLLEIYEKLSRQREEIDAEEFRFWQNFDKDYAAMRENHPEYKNDPWLVSLQHHLRGFLQQTQSFEADIRVRLERSFMQLSQKPLAQAREHWKLRNQEEIIFTGQAGLHELVIELSPLLAAKRSLGIFPRNKSAIELSEEIKQALESGYEVAIDYQYKRDHILYPSLDNPFRVLDKYQPDNKRQPHPKTGKPYDNGGWHSDNIVQLLYDPTTGHVTHLVLQGSHGKEGFWNGRYLMSLEYFDKNVGAIKVLKFRELREWQ